MTKVVTACKLMKRFSFDAVWVRWSWRDLTPSMYQQ